MRFRVTSVAAEETAQPLRSVTVLLEDWLNASLGDGDFGVGIDQFVLVAISVDDVAEENERWAKAHDKTARLKHPFTGGVIRYISSAVLLPPSQVIALPEGSLLSYVSDAMANRVAFRPKRVPKGFDYARCAAAISKALKIHVVPVVQPLQRK
jgi:hypothetical protein